MARLGRAGRIVDGRQLWGQQAHPGSQEWFIMHTTVKSPVPSNPVSHAQPHACMRARTHRNLSCIVTVLHCDCVFLQFVVLSPLRPDLWCCGLFVVLAQHHKSRREGLSTKNCKKNTVTVQNSHNATQICTHAHKTHTSKQTQPPA